MTDVWTITFNQPDKRLSLNDRLHWAVRASRTVNWRTASFVAATGQLGLTRTSRNLPPCLVRVTFPVTYSRRRDSDNTAPTTKAIIDGLVDAGVWADDDTEHVGVLPSRFVKGAGPVVVELTRLP